MKDQFRFRLNLNLILYLLILITPSVINAQTGGNGSFQPQSNSGSTASFTGQPQTSATNNANASQSQTGNANAADSQQMMTYRIKVDDEDIEGFLFEGRPLEASIPAQHRGNIDKIIIEYVGTKYRNLADLKPAFSSIQNQQNPNANNAQRGIDPSSPFDQLNQGPNAQANNQPNQSVLTRTDSNTLGGRSPNQFNSPATNDGTQFMGQANPNNQNGMANQNRPPSFSNQPNSLPTATDWQASRNMGSQQNNNYSANRFSASLDPQDNFRNESGIAVGSGNSTITRSPYENTSQAGGINQQNGYGSLQNGNSGQYGNSGYNNAGQFNNAGQYGNTGIVGANSQSNFQQTANSQPVNGLNSSQGNFGFDNGVFAPPNGQYQNDPRYNGQRFANNTNQSNLPAGAAQNYLAQNQQSNPHQYVNTTNANGPGNLGYGNRQSDAAQPGDQSNTREENAASNPEPKSASDQPATTDTKNANNGAMALFALLCISLGANACLGWFSRGFYVRYRELAEELRSTLSIAA